MPGIIVRGTDIMRTLYIILSLVFVLALLTGGLGLLHAAGAPQQPVDESAWNAAGEDSEYLTSPPLQHTPYVPGRVIVKFREESTPGTQATGVALRQIGVSATEPLFGNDNNSLRAARARGLDRVYRLHLSVGSDVETAVTALNADPAVAYAEPDYLAHAAFEPDDPLFAEQWGLARISAPAAWDVNQGSPAVSIAVIDTGVALSHPELVGKLWQNPGEIGGNGLDDDGNGKVDDVYGWDWVNGDNGPEDDIGHGTHVAGIIAAATDNGEGIAGVCPDCRIMALKVLDASGSGSYSDIASGIYYAADKGARVINLSLGGYADSQLLRDAVAYAAEVAVVVAAAGNDNQQEPFYPAAYDEYVIAVAATDNTDVKTDFSNYGTWVDISAPGVSILSTMGTDNYVAWSGSSMAAPFVSGVAGLIRSQNPGWSAGAVRGQLLHTAEPIDGFNTGYEGKLGSGRLNASRSLTESGGPALAVTGYAIAGVPDGTPEPGSVVTLTISLKNYWLDTSGATARLTTDSPFLAITDDTASYDAVYGYQSVTNDNDPFTIALDSETPYNHSLPLSLTVQSAGGAYQTVLPFTISAATGIEYVSGLIEENTTWEGDRHYIVAGPLTIRPGYTLTIEAGSIVEGELVVQGNVLGVGYPEKEIEVTGGGFRIDGGSLTMSHCWIHDGGITTLNQVRIHLDDCLISNNGVGIHQSHIGIGADQSSLTVTNSQFRGNSQGLSISSATVTLDNVEVSGNGRGVFVSYGLISIRNCQVTDNNTGVWLDQGPGGVIENCLFSGNNLALHLRGYGARRAMAVNNNTFVNNERGVQLTYVGDAPVSVHRNNLIRNQPFSFYNDQGFDHDISQHFWGTTDHSLIDEMIYDILDSGSAGQLHYQPVLTESVKTAPVFLEDVTIVPDDILSTGNFEVRLGFSKPMSLSIQPEVTFGTNTPYDTHSFIGSWISPTHWVGTYNVTYYTGDGIQRLRVAGAIDAEGMAIPEDTSFTFEIATIGATNINAEPGFGKVTLTWEASVLSTLAGYNIYRSTSSGGPYIRLNDSVLTSNSYTDETVSNGTIYYYVVRLLTTDLYESDYGNEVSATPNDFTAPTTPIVLDDGSCTPYHDRLHAIWSASDPDSGITAYQVSIGSWAGGRDVIDWTDVGTSTELTRTGLSLMEGVTYYLNVRARNGVGTWSATGSSDGILVSTGCPVAGFVATPVSGPRPLVVAFTEQNVGVVAERLWDFGDSTTSTTMNPSHAFNTTGQFTVTLTVTGTVGSNVMTRPAYITVNELPPLAAFRANRTSGVAPLEVDFADESSGIIDSWSWTFGDGTTSDVANPSHVYETSGAYTVGLVVRGPGGDDKVVKEAYIVVTSSGYTLFLPGIVR